MNKCEEEVESLTHYGKRGVRMAVVVGTLTRLAGLDITDTLVGQPPWSCHNQDPLDVFHQLPSAVFPS